MPKMTIGQYLLDSLQEYGVRHIFGIPGDYIIRFDKLIENHPIHFINATRENTAGYMADAYARLNGIGCACVTYGVGINIANAVSQAYVESSPVVLISGAPAAEEYLVSPKLHHLFNKSFSAYGDTTQLEIFKQITIAQAVLRDPQTAKQEIDDVLAACVKYKKPVYIELPRDQVYAPLPTPERVGKALEKEKGEPASLNEALAEIESILKNCRKPFLWVGHEIQRFGLVGDVLRFADRYSIPLTTSLLGKTVVDEHHPLFVGVYAGAFSRPEVVDFVEGCDCILALGISDNEMDTGIFTAKLGHEQRVIANAEGVIVKHHTYTEVLFQQLVPALGASQWTICFREQAPHRTQSFTEKFVPKRKKTTTCRFFECLQTHLSEEHIIMADIGDALFGSMDLILYPNSYLSCAYFGSLGFAVPGALGAQMAMPHKRAVVIVGDGAFQMTCTELSTAVRYGLDPIVFVLNNQGYGTERPLLEGCYNDIQNWKYSKLPELLNGGVGVHVTNETELEAACKDAFSREGVLYVIEISLDKMDFSPGLQRLGALAKHRAG